MVSRRFRCMILTGEEQLAAHVWPNLLTWCIRRHGIGRVMDMVLGWIGSDTPIHLSFDVDALDPMWAPSTGTPVRGGLTLREGDFIAECVAETGSLIALDLVEVNPSLDVQGASDTVRAGCSIVRCALGDTLL